MRDKEKLLSFETPLKFIFSHSALREGWDNPNVFSNLRIARDDFRAATAPDHRTRPCVSASTRTAIACAASKATP